MGFGFGVGLKWVLVSEWDRLGHLGVVDENIAELSAMLHRNVAATGEVREMAEFLLSWWWWWENE